MKQFILFFSLLTASVALNSCSKSSDPVPDPPVVGKWNLGRIRFSGYPSPFTSLNVDRPSSGYGLSDVFTIKSDKSFTETYSNPTQVLDLKGTWDFTNNTLQLTYDDSSTESYTLDTSLDPAQLVSSTISAVDSLQASATSPIQAVPFKYQFVYTK